MKTLWNKETNKPVQIGDTLKSFRDEAWLIDGWSEQTGKVWGMKATDLAKSSPTSTRELYHTVFPALEWRDDPPPSAPEPNPFYEGPEKGPEGDEWKGANQ